MIIAVSGTPGTGKTTLAKKLAKELKCKLIDVNKFVKEKKISEGYDKERKCEIVDTKKLSKELIKLIKDEKNLVIDSHLSHYLPKEYVDICVITKCELKELKKRLKKKGYKKEKIRENLDVEIFDTCRVEALEAGHNVIVVDTTKSYNIKEIVKKLK
ncbi:hypothetical protein A3K72_01270 [Candidatus Woesearchaeota archaeon RBG_13_36_6]|nr:MAG: hypothetical protein A3K72_01270 [Candidatus Woesearchaeota archaeon RBG_13_36_6]